MRTTEGTSPFRIVLGASFVAAALLCQRAPAQGSSGPAAGFPAHYLVFELDPAGVPQPLSHQIVRLATPPRSGSDAAIERRLATANDRTDQVVVRLLGSDEVVAFQDVVDVPRWVNLERGLHGEPSPVAGELRPSQRVFAVRVPIAGGTRLRLSSGRGLKQGSTIDVDLASPGLDARLPLGAPAGVRGPLAPPANPGNRADFLVMGDGYTAGEETKFETDAARVLDGFFDISPYREYRSFVNVAKLFTPSAQAGADHPPFERSCAATAFPSCCGDPEMQSDPLRGTFADTAFDATYCGFNIHRLLVVNAGKVLTAAAAYPDWDTILVIVNDSTSGGSGGSLLVTAAHAYSAMTAQHEYGHTFSGLADEYASPYPGFPPCSDLGGLPPCEPNVTDETRRSLIKWSPWIDPFTPVPTTSGGGDLVGLFEGARYLETGMYRPQRYCAMRLKGAPFCRVCAEAYVLRLYSGGWGIPAYGIDNIEPGTEKPPPGSVTLPLPANLPMSVELLQPLGDTVWTRWTVNGVTAGSGSTFAFRASTPGTYVVRLGARDATPLVSSTSATGMPGTSRTWVVQAAGSGSGSPAASFELSPAFPTAGQEVRFASGSSDSATSWSWSFGEGGTSTEPNPVHVFREAGVFTVELTETDGFSWSTASRTVSVRPAEPEGETSVLTVPIVLSSSGANGSFFTSELTLTNRGTTDATVSYAYTAAFGGSSGGATDRLPAGRQMIVPDAIEYLEKLGVPLGSSGNRGGTLRITFTGLSSRAAGAATVRTTTSVPEGRAGLAYTGVPASKLLAGPVYVFGLRQNATDRSNVAVLNAGTPSDGEITLRLTVISGDSAKPEVHALPEFTLPPGGFRQVSGVLASDGLTMTDGTVKIERTLGGAPFLAYGVINDQANSDGSFVEPVPAEPPAPVTALTLPVIVEAGVFSTEAILTNLTSVVRWLRLTYVASALRGGSVTFRVGLAPFEQMILPGFVQFLRGYGIIPGAPGPVFSGALFATDETGDLRGVLIGARTSAPGGGGRYGVCYPAVPAGSEATTSAWLYGLQQNAVARTNLALVNVGSREQSSDVFRIDLYDGATGVKAATVHDVSMHSSAFLQIDSILARYAPGLENGYALVTRTSGTNPFIAYAVVNDGSRPGQRSGDGAFVAASVPARP